jgi:ABC-type phosphate transport system substrate-binding protein
MNTKTLGVALRAALVVVVLPALASAGEMVVIVNAANGTASLTPRAARASFLKSSPNWKSGERIRPVDLSGASPLRSAFLAKVLGMTSEDLERYWIEKQYVSAEPPPQKAADEAAAIKAVKTNQGAIGFVSREALASGDAGVKAVLSVTY